MKTNNIQAVLVAAAMGLSILTFGASTYAMTLDGASPTLDDIQHAIDKGHYDLAIKDLKVMVETESNNPDAWNLLGFSFRKVGQLDLSWDAYERALILEPDHLGANEYLGELYIAQGNMQQADAQLDKLKMLCPSGCEALANLQTAISDAQ